MALDFSVASSAELLQIDMVQAMAKKRLSLCDSLFFVLSLMLNNIVVFIIKLVFQKMKIFHLTDFHPLFIF